MGCKIPHLSSAACGDERGRNLGLLEYNLGFRDTCTAGHREESWVGNSANIKAFTSRYECFVEDLDNSESEYSEERELQRIVCGLDME